MPDCCARRWHALLLGLPAGTGSGTTTTAGGSAVGVTTTSQPERNTHRRPQASPRPSDPACQLLRGKSGTERRDRGRLHHSQMSVSTGTTVMADGQRLHLRDWAGAPTALSRAARPGLPTPRGRCSGAARCSQSRRSPTGTLREA